MSYRVWVVGLDGATFDLIRPWAQEGHLPAFSRLMREGSWGEVRSTFPPLTGTAWTTLVTGTNPGKHSIYDFTFRRPGTYDFPPTTGENNRQPSLWQLLEPVGKRSLVLNVPWTYPPEPVNGLLVSGMPATELVTYPPELAQKIWSMIPEYVVYPDPGQAYSDQGIDAFVDEVERTIQGDLKMWQELIHTEPWDFAMIVFMATDVVQHALWKFMSPQHPQYNAQKAAKYGQAILNVYKSLDSVLAQVMAAVDENTVLLVTSDHGFGPLHQFFHVNTWMIQEGLMCVRPNVVSRLKALLFRLGFSPMFVYNILMNIGLGKLKGGVVRGRSQILRNLFLSFNDVDWSKTVAYSMGNIGSVRINVKGREPHGIVERGEAYERVVKDVIERLSRVRDPKNGELIVEHIYRREELYTGDAFDEAPDIIFLPRRLEYFGFGEYEFGDHRVIVPVTRGISGTHRMNGIGLAWGKPIRQGHLQGARLEDLAPTIMHLMGQPIPAHMDGRPLLEALAEQAGLPPPQDGPAWKGKQASGKELSPEEQEQIRQRLKDLGYVA